MSLSSLSNNYGVSPYTTTSSYGSPSVGTAPATDSGLAPVSGSAPVDGSTISPEASQSAAPSTGFNSLVSGLQDNYGDSSEGEDGDSDSIGEEGFEQTEKFIDQIAA